MILGRLFIVTGFCKANELYKTKKKDTYGQNDSWKKGIWNTKTNNNEEKQLKTTSTIKHTKTSIS